MTSNNYKDISECAMEMISVITSAVRLANYIEECYPGLGVTEEIRENIKVLQNRIEKIMAAPCGDR